VSGPTRADLQAFLAGADRQDREEFFRIARAHEYLDHFAWYVMRDNQGRKFDVQDYQLAWCDLAEALERGERRHLVVTAPPGHAKSTWWSVALPAWFLGRRPQATVICAGNTLDIVAPFSKAVRSLVADNARYRAVFPLARLDPEMGEAFTHWYLKGQRGGQKDPNYVCAGVGTGIAGRRADLLLLDDPVKRPEQVQTQEQRDAMERWFWEVFYARRRRAGRPVVVIGTRWHQDDLLGRLMARPDWEVVEFPAIRTDENGEEHALWPAQFPIEELRRLRDPATGIGTRAFSCEYMCSPTPPEGGIIKAEWAERRWPRDVPEPMLPGFWDEGRGQYIEYSDREREEAGRAGRPVIEAVVQAWDVAESPSLGSDFSAVVTVGMDEHGRKFVLDAWWGRETAPQLERRMVELYRRWRPMEVVVEKASSGNALLQSIEDAHPELPFGGVRPEGNKALRLEAVARQFEAGQVFFPESGREMPTSKRGARGNRPWPDALISLVVGFPGVEVDDPVDALVYALRRLEHLHRHEPRIIEV
jgi:predicted phage terminase large subunit-like protein